MDSVSGNTPEGYTVTRQQAASCDECVLKGSTCTAMECNGLCIHMYKCDKKCYIFNNVHICKHIHHVHSLSQVKPQGSTMEVTKELPTSDDTEHQCDSVDNTEPTSLNRSLILKQVQYACRNIHIVRTYALLNI